MTTSALDFPTAPTAPRGRALARRIVLGQYAAVVAVLALWVLLEKFLGAESGLAFAVISTPLLIASTLAIAVWAAWKIRTGKVLLLLAAVALDVCFVAGTSAIERAGDRLFFETRRARLETFAGDIASYGRIDRMSDGRRHFTELNGELVADAADGPGDAAGAHGIPLPQLLARDGVSPARYEEFRRTLLDLKLIQFDAEPGYVAFLYDGMVEELEGYLLVKPGEKPPKLEGTLFGATLTRLDSLGNGWYRFAAS